MPNPIQPKMISGNANRALSNAIARRMSMYRGMQIGLVDARVERFNDQEIFVEVFENVRGEDMFVIQPTSNPANDNLMELLIMSDALRRSSAGRITAVIPYFGYARQDRRTKARTPITAKLVANMLVSAGVERVLTMDLHAAMIIILFIVIGETNPREDHTSILEKANLDVLENIQKNETFREEVIGLSAPVNETEFSQVLLDFLDSKRLPSTNCTYWVCGPTSDCLISKDFADETYSSESLIFSTKDTYDPKKFKIYCTKIS